jgi:hypothetical protein
MINGGTFDELVAPQLGPEMASYIKEQLINLSPYLFAMAGPERLFTIVIHIALSLVVLLAVTKSKNIYLLYAILLHALVNYPVVIIPGWGLSLWFAEFYLLLLAIWDMYLSCAQKTVFPKSRVSTEHYHRKWEKGNRAYQSPYRKEVKNNVKLVFKMGAQCCWNYFYNIYRCRI